MRFSIVFAIFVAFSCFAAAPAFAASKWGPFPWIFPYWGWDQDEMARPYLEDGKTPHNSQWADDPWTPQDWIDAKGSAEAVMEGFYRNGVIIRQDDKARGRTPVVVVGQNFMRLSGQEKRRVAAFIDHVSGYTKAPEGLYVIEHRASGDPVGVYTAAGLQLQ